MDLNHARLPIPPLRHGEKEALYAPMTCRSCLSTLACKWIVTHGFGLSNRRLWKPLAGKFAAATRSAAASVQRYWVSGKAGVHEKGRILLFFVLVFCAKIELRTIFLLFGSRRNLLLRLSRRRLQGTKTLILLLGFAPRSCCKDRVHGIQRSFMSEPNPIPRQNSLADQQGTPDACARPQQFH